MLPLVHASALVNSGGSQVLAALTVGSSNLAQASYGLSGQVSQRIMLQASSPGFAHNEVRAAVSPVCRLAMLTEPSAMAECPDGWRVQGVR